MQDESRVIAQTSEWVSVVVVGENFCPFARREVVNNRVRYRVAVDDQVESILVMLLEELQHLEASSDTETTLLICPQGFDDFNEYLDLYDLAEAQLERAGFEGKYQVASFHPLYCFTGAEALDAANYTNRSPYPMLHLIREDSIERVLENIENPEDIPDRNIRHARTLGLEVMRQKLADCLKK